MLLPHRVKVSDTKNTFHTNISTLHMLISITFTETSINETNKTQQKVRGSKFMFKMSTIHTNTCILTTTPLRNRWWFWVAVSSPGATQLHFLEPGVKVNGDYYRNTVLLNMLLLDIRSVLGDYYVFSKIGHAPAHRSRDTVTMLQRETPEFIPPEMWPPNSPDLNPVDYSIWGMFQERVYTARGSMM